MLARWQKENILGKFEFWFYVHFIYLASFLTCAGVVTCFMHFAFEKLQAYDGIDGDHEEHQQRDVEQGQHGLENGAHHHLQAWSRHNILTSQLEK